LYLSDLADHTKNLHHSPKSSLTIIKLNTNGDKQNSERLTIMGDLVPVSDDELDSCKKRYYQILPESKMYAKMHDFNFYKIQIKNVRWIGGFGKIAWLDVSNWEDKLPKWSKSEGGIIEHMNEDHSDTIVAALKAQHGVDDNSARMVQLTIDGYYLKTESKLSFIKFPVVCYNSKEYKDALVALAKLYK
jgi:putative heme iron utilization protein